VSESLVGDVLDLRVGAPAHGGHCVARIGDEPHGRVVFVRHALPGERVRARVTEDAGGAFCRADAVDVLEPSPDRVTPPCPHAGPGRCGGCDWQHASDSAQRALKAAVVGEQLLRLAGLDVAVEVEPRPKLEASPSRLSFELQPGAEVTADVTLLNVGNVPYEVPAASTFCVFDGSGVDHAFWVAFGSDPPEGKERIDLLLDDLAESHGGLVEVRARAAERTIPPGESREVQVGLRFSDRIRPGHTYAGSWGGEGLSVRVRVSVPAAKEKVPR